MKMDVYEVVKTTDRELPRASLSSSIFLWGGGQTDCQKYPRCASYQGD